MKKSGILMIIGSVLLLGLFKFPLWNIMLEAPQYPNPLGMDIFINGLKGVEEFDIQNIDGLNHYIGMQKLPQAQEMWEFKIFPIVIGFMSLLGIILGLIGIFKTISPKFFLGWLVLMVILGILGMYDFNLWLLDYGSNLDTNAIMKMMDESGKPLTYEPPLLGHRKILNFDAYSYPTTGAYFMFVGLGLTLLAYIIRKKELKKKQA